MCVFEKHMHRDLLKRVLINLSQSILLFSPEGKPHSLEKSSLPGSALQTIKNLHGSIPCQASQLMVRCPSTAM